MSPRRLSLALLVVTACSGDEPQTPAPDFGGGTDSFGSSPVDAKKLADLHVRAKDLIEPGSTLQVEPRLGVPTFVWAREPATASSRARFAAAGIAKPEATAARETLARYAPLYGLSDAEVAHATVAHVDSNPNGASIVKLHSEVSGIEVFREELAVVLDRNLDAVALGGYLANTVPARAGAMDFQLGTTNAAAIALAHMAKTPVDPAQLAPVSRADGYELYGLAANAAVTLDDPVRMKRVYYRQVQGLEAAYYIELTAFTGAPQPGTISIDGNDKSLEAYAYLVSASTGQLLFRTSLIANDHTYRVWADPVTKLPGDTPSGNAPHPKLTTVPDGAQAPFVPPSDVTLANFPFTQNDPWLAPGATETNGNNVDAFLNLFSPDGIGNPITTTPSDPPTGDFRAQVTGVGQFLHAQDPTANVSLAEGRQGAIQQLFYDINFLHDWYYDAGFNEAAGNAQKTNFGRGGLQNDDIKGQAQDFSGFANANMLTPADGTRPRMRMYKFLSPANHLEVLSPAGIGKVGIGASMSGPQSFDITANIVRATFNPTPGCAVTNAAALAGNIAMFDFDNTDGTGCSFAARQTQLQGTAAVGLVMAWQAAVPTQVVVITGFNAATVKPIATISFNSRNAIVTALGSGPVSIHILRAQDFDGTVDNQIVFHEWAHFLSNRLVGNASGLGAQAAAGMGEGWGDFNAMLLTVREDDTANPTNTSWNGVYALATHALGGARFDGAPNDQFYFGIRRYPYSTDTTKNPLTFGHIQNGVVLPVGPPIAFGADGSNNAEVHNTGEVWTTMLWECYAALLRDTLGATPRLTFAQAQDRMKRYIVGGLKATPTFPTFTEARDAILAVAFATDVQDYIAFRIAFAKRGAGKNAVAPDRFSTTNTPVVEDFNVGADLALTTTTLDDSLESCDADGVVDHGEYGKLSMTVRNTGITPLTATSATVTTASSGIWLPSGNTVQFPAIPVNQSATVSLRIALPPSSTGIAQADFQITISDPQVAAPVVRTASFRLDTDDVPASSATDTVETAATTWTPSAGALPNVAPWTRAVVTALDREWHVDDPNAGSDQRLTSPVFTVDGSGSLNVQFDHAWSFEFDGGGNYDGGVVEMSVNGGAFTDIGGPAYTGLILAGGINPLANRNGFVRSSGGVVHTSLTQAIAPGSTVQVRFRSGSDVAGSGAGWNIDNIAFTGVVETPFATLVQDADACTVVPSSADLAITKTDGVTTVTAGGATTYTIVASNAGPGNIIGATVSDAIPSELACTWTCASGGGGGVCGSAGGSGNIVDHPTLPAGGSTMYTLACAVSTSTSSTSVANTATIANPGPVTDPNPANNSATDTDTLLHLPAHVFGSKTVAGTFTQGGTVTYTVILGNDGTGIQFDNPNPELTDVLPAGLSLVSASATSGTAVATVLSNTVTWDGAIAVNGTVTITIIATINAAAGTSISNQGTYVYDNDGNGTNESTGVTDAFPCN